MTVFGGVLAEWREHDAVLELQAANSEGGEEFGNWVVVGLRIGGCSTRRGLQGCEIGDLGALENWGRLGRMRSYAGSTFVYDTCLIFGLGTLLGDGVVDCLGGRHLCRLLNVKQEYLRDQLTS